MTLDTKTVLKDDVFYVDREIRKWLWDSCKKDVTDLSDRDAESVFLLEAARMNIAPNLLFGLIETMWD